MMISQENICSIIPQRPPFVMIDQLVDCDALHSKTLFCIRADNVLVDRGELSEAGLIENIAQTIAAWAGYRAQQTAQPVSVGYIGAVKNLNIFSLPKVGDVINTEATVIDQVLDALIITGNIECNGTLIAKCEMKIFSKK